MLQPLVSAFSFLIGCSVKIQIKLNSSSVGLYLDGDTLKCYSSASSLQKKPVLYLKIQFVPCSKHTLFEL